MSRQRNGQKLRILLLLILAFAVFSSPTLLRWYYNENPTYIGTPTFMHARISQYIIDGTFDWYDPLSYGGRPYTYQPLFSFGMALLGMVIGLKLATVFFVSLFGAVGIVFFYLIAKKFAKENYALLATVLLVFIPATIFVNSHISTRAPGVALGLAALYLVMRKTDGNKNILSAGILLGISFLFHFEPAIVFLIIILFYFIGEKSIKKKSNRPNNASYRDYLKIVAVSVLIALIWYGPFLLQYGLPDKNALHDDYRERRLSLESPTLENYIWEINNRGALSSAIAILSIIGFFAARSKFLRFWILFIFLATLVFERFFIYLPFVAAIIVVEGLTYLNKRINKKYFVILLIILVVYTLTFGVHRILFFANDYPIQQQTEAFLWIKNNTPENATILTDWMWGHWIPGIAERRNFIDGYAEYAPNVNKRLEELYTFYSNCTVPKNYGIQYVYMEDWFAERRNMTCLSGFSVVFDKHDIKVYKV